MDNVTLINRVRDLVKKQLKGEGTGHDWFHIERVYNMACHLQQQEGGDRMVIELAALLHDISDHKFNGGSATLGGEVAFELLKKETVSNEVCEKVKQVILEISFKGAEVQDQTSSLEAKIVQDADRLDAIGAIGIARAFAYGGNRNRPLYDPEDKPVMHTTFEAYKNSKSHTINHFYEKLLLLHEKLHTTTAKEIGLTRHAFMEEYLNQFYSEWNFGV